MSSPSPTPVARGPAGNTLKRGALKVHPSIGIARVGNSAAFFIGPEVPGSPPVGQDGAKGSSVASGSSAPFSGFKTNPREIKRQGQRFRLFLYAPGRDPEEVTLDTPGVADIEWKVQLANKKAAFFQFDGQKGNHPNLVYSPATAERNPGLVPRPIIDPGRPQVISGRDQGPKKIDSSMGGSWPRDHTGAVAIDLLGELHTDAKGRVIVLGGNGEAKPFVAGAGIADYANNDGWLDSVSDGFVTATVKLATGDSVDATAAWVLVGPPDFAPEVGNAVTLYDTLWSAAALAKLPIPRNNPVFKREPLRRLAAFIKNRSTYRPEFNSDIEPMLQRVVDQKWVFGPAFTAHATVEAERLSRTGSTLLTSFSRPVAGNKNTSGPGSMPLLLGNEYSTGSDHEFLSLTEVQLENLKHFERGTFDVVPRTSGITPEGLDRAALESCVGGAFFPGIEASWMIANPKLYAEPFRLKKLNTVLNPGMTPPLRIEPGLFSQQMALPWQADFFMCKREDVTGSGRFFGWWPAQRPDDVRKGGVSMAWARGVVSMTDLVKEWRSRGFVVRSGAEFVEEGGPPFPTNVSVIFTQIEVLDDASLFGPGSWTVNATVSGTGQSLLAARSVDTGDRIALTQTVAKTIAPGGDLVIRVDGTDSAGTADALGVAAFRFNAGSTPPFGVGVQSRTSSTGNYKITLEIRVVP